MVTLRRRFGTAIGTVYRRETPAGATSWVAHLTWQEGGRRRQSKRTYRTKKEAQQAIAELIATHRTGTFVAPSRLTLRDFAVGWLAGLETQGRKASTLRGYRQVLDLYLLPRLGHVSLQDLRTPDFDKLYRDLLAGGGRNGRPLSMTSVHHVHAAANKLLNDAERKGLVTRNVARLADAPPLTTRRRWRSCSATGQRSVSACSCSAARCRPMIVCSPPNSAGRSGPTR